MCAITTLVYKNFSFSSVSILFLQSSVAILTGAKEFPNFCSERYPVPDYSAHKQRKYVHFVSCGVVSQQIRRLLRGSL